MARLVILLVNALPSWWAGAGITAKADYLVRTGQAKDFHEACSILSRRRRRHPQPVDHGKARLPYKDDDDCPSAGNYWDK